MIVRLIIFIALVSLLILVYRKFTANKQATPPEADAASMRKCAQCGIHLPESEACTENGKFFCSDTHRQAYLNNNKDD
ncbi:MAG: hypothetical protein GY938_27760 [Ketobacter sp.]|nr:hypothetical protein [Ketobacter sp.]